MLDAWCIVKRSEKKKHPPQAAGEYIRENAAEPKPKINKPTRIIDFSSRSSSAAFARTSEGWRGSPVRGDFIALEAITRRRARESD